MIIIKSDSQEKHVRDSRVIPHSRCRLILKVERKSKSQKRRSENRWDFASNLLHLINLIAFTFDVRTQG